LGKTGSRKGLLWEGIIFVKDSKSPACVHVLFFFAQGRAFFGKGAYPETFILRQKYSLINDHDTFNRLYEFIGQQQLNEMTPFSIFN
jgi:hypothetical protein